jgi:mRNA interferase RelE/StbE
MATYQIEWKESAQKELRRLPHLVVGRIITAVDALAENPFSSGVVKLTGAEYSFRIRVGDYRVIYTVEKAVLTIQIIRVRHRRDVYR